MLLQTVAADRKSRVLKEFMQVALAEFNLLFSHVKGAVPYGVSSQGIGGSEGRTGFNVQVRCSLIRDAYRKNAKCVEALTVKFNIPRNAKTFRTNQFLCGIAFQKRRKGCCAHQAEQEL